MKTAWPFAGSILAIAMLMSVPATRACAAIASVAPDAEYTLPGGQYFDPRYMTLGPDGNVWTTMAGNSKIASTTPAGVTTQYPTSTFLTNPALAIAQGADGNLWFIENGVKIGKCTTAGVVTEFPSTVTPAANSNMVLASDGNVYFCASVGGFGRITTAGALSLVSVTANVNLSRLTVGPDGYLWATEPTTNTIYHCTLSGIYTTLTAPTASSAPTGIVTGSDGNVWFLEKNSQILASITMGGAITEYALPTPFTSQGNLFAAPGLSFLLPASGTGILQVINPGPSQISQKFTSSYQIFASCAGLNGSFWFDEYAVSLGTSIGEFHPTIPAPAASSLAPIHISGRSGSYSAICPSTLAGVAALQTLVAQGHERSGSLRAFAWDAVTQAFVELPAQPSGGLLPSTGVFIASLIDRDLDIAGNVLTAPYSITLRPGWNFVGVPPLQDGTAIDVSHPLSSFTLYTTAQAILSGAARTSAMGSAWEWNGSSYASVSTMTTGRAYWIQNLSGQTLSLVRVNTLSGGVAILGAREQESPSLANGQSPPPWMPLFGDHAPSRACGSGGGLALLGALTLWFSRGRSRKSSTSKA